MTGQSNTHDGARRRQEAEQTFLENMKLVPHVISKMGFPITDDALQDGYIGLWKASLMFDEKRGTKFATFAVPVIRNSIIMAWRNATRGVQPDISLDQPYLHDESGDTQVIYLDALEDPESQRPVEDVCYDMYLDAVLTETEKRIARMRMEGKAKTAIGRAFGHSDYWVNDRIKSIRRKIQKDF